MKATRGQADGKAIAELLAARKAEAAGGRTGVTRGSGPQTHRTFQKAGE